VKVNIERTTQYYESLTPDDLCTCDHCRLYYREAAAAYPELAAWLRARGAEITKPFEAMSLEPDSNGTLAYPGVQYVLFGTCPEDYQTTLGSLTIRRTDSHPSTGITEPHFVLEAGPMELKAGRSEF